MKVSDVDAQQVSGTLKVSIVCVLQLGRRVGVREEDVRISVRSACISIASP